VLPRDAVARKQLGVQLQSKAKQCDGPAANVCSGLDRLVLNRTDTHAHTHARTHTHRCTHIYVCMHVCGLDQLTSSRTETNEHNRFGAYISTVGRDFEPTLAR
jgi:hypothetical protein